MKLESALRRLTRGNGPEQRAIAAGEIDAIIDYAGSNVILLPAARRALREAADRTPAGNRLLAALPREDYRRLAGGFETLTLESAEVLHEPGAPMRHVYFPVECVVSLLAPGEAGAAVGVGLVGHEGMVGIPLALGVEVSSVRAVVQAGGTALRMSTARFHDVLRQCLPLQRELHRYAGAQLAQARQSVVCNRFHPVEARLARWLLMTAERVRSGGFFLTQAVLAELFGMRRATICAAAASLQSRSLIRYRRGHVRILDRAGLAAAACRCYASAAPRGER
jgi:CRP-like cAMP-binding protein